MRKPITREKFSEIIKDFPQWKNYLNPKQLQVANLWYNENKTYEEIGNIIGVQKNRIKEIITGANQYSKNGVISVIKNAKRNCLNKRIKEYEK